MHEARSSSLNTTSVLDDTDHMDSVGIEIIKKKILREAKFTANLKHAHTLALLK